MLIWDSFCQELNLTDPQTMAELVTWDAEKMDFVRPLDPDYFKWDKTKVFFMNLGLVSAYFKVPGENLCCPTCKQHTLVSNGWCRTLRRVCSSDGSPAFLKYMQYRCKVCESQSAPVYIFIILIIPLN